MSPNQKNTNDDLSYHEWCRTLTPYKMRLHGSSGPKGGASYWHEEENRLVEVDHAILIELDRSQKFTAWMKEFSPGHYKAFRMSLPTIEENKCILR